MQATEASQGEEGWSERMTEAWVLANFGLDDAAVCAIYLYGSRVYGTQGPASDWDYIIVVEDCAKSAATSGMRQGDSADLEDTIQGTAGDADATVMSVARFAQLLDEHAAPILECVFLPPHMKLRERRPWAPPFRVSPQRVREAASFRAGHSWSKARKKLEVAADRNVRVARKSLFHSFRILDFALQMAKEGKIMHYDAMNALWREVEAFPDDTPWETYKLRYQKEWNRLKSQLRAACPKEEWQEQKKDLRAVHERTRHEKDKSRGVSQAQEDKTTGD